jgi:hypothetical protein
LRLAGNLRHHESNQRSFFENSTKQPKSFYPKYFADKIFRFKILAGPKPGQSGVTSLNPRI